MRNLIDRRDFIKTSALVTTSLSINPLTAFSSSQNPQSGLNKTASKKAFAHRGYLGWITDLATEPAPNAEWPSIRLDEQLMRDYQQTFKVMRNLNFNEMSLWGIYVSRNWPVEIEKAVAPERAVKVEKLIEWAHQSNIRLYAGLGVFSWGFEEIIRAFPKLSRGNKQAMCPHEPESWKWMEKVVDYVFGRFPIDGVSMQSADQGRCDCAECHPYTDAEYHALINVRVADYIRGRWPKKTIGINSWGMKFEEPATLPSLVKMSEKVDYIIDVHDTSRRIDPLYRQKVIQAIKCDFGTLGGPQAEPPQHWARDRWFLPTLKRVGTHLRQLSAEGGAACEYFFHILANPGDELSLWLAGKVLADPATAWEKHLENSVEEVFQVSKKSTRDAIIKFCLEAEEAYFKYLPPDVCGTISLEPLVSSRPGEPVYLTKRLTGKQRLAYADELRRLKKEVEKLIPELPVPTKVKKIADSMGNVIQEITQLNNSKTVS